LNEQELIDRLQQRDEHAFQQLVMLFRDRVFNTALGLVQQPVDAEDIAQEVFIKVHNSIIDFKQLSGLSTWIYRITVNKCLDHLRSIKRKKKIWPDQYFWGQ